MVQTKAHAGQINVETKEGEGAELLKYSCDKKIFLCLRIKENLT